MTAHIRNRQQRRSWIARWAAPALAVASFVALASSAFHAQTQPGPNFEVNVADDSDDGSCGDAPDDCTLREAVAAANANSNASTITFAAALAGQTIALSTIGDSTYGPSALLVSSPIIIEGIDGPSGVTIGRNSAVQRLRLFYVSTSGALTLRNLTLSNGRAVGFDGGWTGVMAASNAGQGGGGGAAGLGGAIFNRGTLTIDRSTLAGNLAQGGNGGSSGGCNNGSGGGGLNGDGSAGCTGGVSDRAGGAGGGGDGGYVNGSTDPNAAFPVVGRNGGFGGGGGGGAWTCNGGCSGRAGGRGGFGGGGGGTGGYPSPGHVGGQGGFGGGNGNTSGSAGCTAGGGGGGLGGAVFNHSGTLTVTNSTFSGNTARGGNGGNGEANGYGGNGGSAFGGSLFNLNGTVAVTNSTFASSAVEVGLGGLADPGGGVVSASNGAARGGAIYNLSHGNATGITEASATLTLVNTILADSTGGSSDLVNQQLAASAASVDASFPNIAESAIVNEGGTVAAAGVLAVDPGLLPLAANGGPTFTHALQTSPTPSPAIDAGYSSGAGVDQRGYARPFDSPAVTNASDGSDIGAYESDSAPPATEPNLLVTALSAPPASVAQGQTFTVTDTTSNQGAGVAGDSTTRYRLSSDTVITSGDALLTGTRAVASLNPATASSDSVDVTVPLALSPGTYYLGACADDLAAVDESNETDNCLASSSTVEVAAAAVADLTIAKTHIGNFRQGQSGAQYTITVTNSGSAPTTGQVTVTDTPPAGLTATAIGGTNWSCTQPAGPCTTNGALAPSASYSPITLTVTVAANASSTVTNNVAVSGGGEANIGNNAAADPTTVLALPPGVCTVEVAGTGSHTSIQAAINDGSCATIDVGAGTYTENLLIERSLTINGAGPRSSDTTISGNNTTSVIWLDAGSLTLNRLAITNGYGFGGHTAGGAIDNHSNLTLNRVLIYGNHGFAGGVYSRGFLTVNSSTFSGNTADNGFGGALRIDGGAVIANSTFFNNGLDLGSFGASHGGAIFATTSFFAFNSTFVGNTAVNTGSAISISSGTATLQNTIIAGNVGASQCSPLNSAQFTGDHNLDSGTTCGFGGANGSMSNATVNLGPLQNNGGPTDTMALLAGSLGISAGDASVCSASPVSSVDQRDVARPQGPACDIGAVESDQIAGQRITVTTSAPGTAAANGSFPVAATASSNLAVSITTTGGCSGSGSGSAIITMTSSTTACVVHYNQAGDANYNAAPEVTSSTTPGAANQSITVTTGAPSSAAFNSTFPVAATASSGLAVAITTTGGCSIASGTVTLNSSTTTCEVHYNQAGDANYNAATEVTSNTTATPASQSISVTTGAPSSATFNSTFPVAATASSGLDVAITTTGGCSGSGSASATVTMTSGTTACVVHFNQTGNSNYSAATEVLSSVTATKASQTISFGPLPDRRLNQSPVTVSATSSSLLSVTFTTTTPSRCSAGGANGATITLLTTGTCTVKADQIGNGNYSAAASVTQSFTIGNKSDQTITVSTAAPATASYATTFPVAATASSGLAVAITTTGGCSIAGGTVTMTSGTTACAVHFNQAGNGSYNPAPEILQSVSAQKINQTITVTTGPPASAPFNGSFPVAATAAPGLGVSITTTGGCVGSGTGSATVTMNSSTTTCVVHYNQPGNANYTAAIEVLRNVTATKANQTISFGGLANRKLNQSPITVNATASSGLAVAFTTTTPSVCTSGGTNGATITLIATGTCSVKADQGGNGNYNAAASVTQNFTVRP
jgi:CSLREA domain-containing protein